MNQDPVLANGRKRKIILLEDDPLLSHLFESIIRDCCKDADLLTFENGDEAWRELSRSRPDLLITDALHPGLHGGVIVGRLVEKHPNCAMLWTSGGSDCELPSCFAGLQLEVLPKPFGKKQLEEKLKLLIESEPIPALEVVPLIQNPPHTNAGQDAALRE